MEESMKDCHPKLSKTMLSLFQVKTSRKKVEELFKKNKKVEE